LPRRGSGFLAAEKVEICGTIFFPPAARIALRTWLQARIIEELHGRAIRKTDPEFFLATSP